MDIALVVGLIIMIGIPLLLLLCFSFWSFFILPRLEKKWERDSSAEAEELWNKFMTKKALMPTIGG